MYTIKLYSDASKHLTGDRTIIFQSDDYTAVVNEAVRLQYMLSIGYWLRIERQDNLPIASFYPLCDN